MRVVEDEIVLSSGRILYAHGGVLGLGTDGVACQGWDGDLGDEQLTPEERLEIGREMARRWLAWGNGDLVELGKVSDTGKPCPAL